jgi:hypothetical protein
MRQHSRSAADPLRSECQAPVGQLAPSGVIVNERSLSFAAELGPARSVTAVEGFLEVCGNGRSKNDD